MRCHRQSIRLKDYDYSSEGAYFVTICTHDRECLFGDILDGEMRLNEWGQILQQEWFRTEQIRSYVQMDQFVVMPNHAHGIIILNAPVGATRRVAPTPVGRPQGPKAGSIGAIIGQFKSITTKRINRLRGTPAIPVWQRNYYERVIRKETELFEMRQYIQENPLKWDLDPENPNRTLRAPSLQGGGRPGGSPLP